MADTKRSSAKKAAAKKVASKKKAASKKKTASGKRSSSRTNRTHRAREKFLEVLAERANVTEACRVAGIARSTVYEWYENDPEFERQWGAAEAEAADALEREAWRRAVEGTDKPIAYQGVISDSYKEYSDRMLELLLRARRPEKYSEKHRVDHSGGLTVNIGYDLSAGDNQQ